MGGDSGGWEEMNFQIKPRRTVKPRQTEESRFPVAEFVRIRIEPKQPEVSRLRLRPVGKSLSSARPTPDAQGREHRSVLVRRNEAHCILPSVVSNDTRWTGRWLFFAAGVGPVYAAARFTPSIEQKGTHREVADLALDTVLVDPRRRPGGRQPGSRETSRRVRLGGSGGPGLVERRGSARRVVVQDGVLTATEDQCLWTKKQYENFLLDLEFKNGARNEQRGDRVLLRRARTGSRIRSRSRSPTILRRSGRSARKTWQCAAIFGHAAPATKSVVKKPGEWNRMTLTCRGPIIYGVAQRRAGD